MADPTSKQLDDVLGDLDLMLQLLIDAAFHVKAALAAARTAPVTLTPAPDRRTQH